MTKNWEKPGVSLPAYDVQKMREKTKKLPIWVHFGAGNIFRGFIAVLQQKLLNSGDSECGIIAAETFDTEIINKVYAPHDNTFLNVLLGADGTLDCAVVSSISEAIALKQESKNSRKRLVKIFTNPSLQMVSFTITEKGYSLRDVNSNLLPVVLDDFEKGPDAPGHVMCIITGFLYQRYMAGKHPIAMVSMDNLAKNGDVLKAAVMETAEAWHINGFVDSGFMKYLNDKTSVSFPWTMIDKITPRPDAAVAELLKQRGITDIDPFVTAKDTHIAPFVNSERPEYLVVEDDFPAGRPVLEKAGVYFTDRDTVNRVERMKVTACLNPLHTSMSVYGCLLGYTRISEEMKDSDITKLIMRLGYVEGLPVAADPGILSPKAFLDEVINERLPNPFMPDSPQRIVTDTSQKVGIRFGETIKSYKTLGFDMEVLVAIPLSIAGWLRYLLAVDDEGSIMEVSSDPLKKDLQKILSGIVWNDPKSYKGQILDILKNSIIFGCDLTKTSLGVKIEEMFVSLLSGKGAVRQTLQYYLNDKERT